MQPGRLRYNSCPPGTPHPVILSEAQRAESKDLGGGSRISHLVSKKIPPRREVDGREGYPAPSSGRQRKVRIRRQSICFLKIAGIS